MALQSKMIASAVWVAGAAVALTSVWAEGRQHQAVNHGRIAIATTPVAIGAAAKQSATPLTFGQLHANAHLENLRIVAEGDPADFFSVASR